MADNNINAQANMARVADNFENMEVPDRMPRFQPVLQEAPEAPDMVDGVNSLGQIFQEAAQLAAPVNHVLFVNMDNYPAPVMNNGIPEMPVDQPLVPQGPIIPDVLDPSANLKSGG